VNIDCLPKKFSCNIFSWNHCECPKQTCYPFELTKRQAQKVIPPTERELVWFEGMFVTLLFFYYNGYGSLLFNLAKDCPRVTFTKSLPTFQFLSALYQDRSPWIQRFGRWLSVAFFWTEPNSWRTGRDRLSIATVNRSFRNIQSLRLQSSKRSAENLKNGLSVFMFVTLLKFTSYSVIN
jgi:hypothetical protein